MKKILIGLILPILLALAILVACSGENMGGDETTKEPAGDTQTEKNTEGKTYQISDIVRTDYEIGAKDLYQKYTVGKPEGVVLESGKQVLVLEQQEDKSYAVMVYLFDGTDYVSLFDAKIPLMDGISNPTAYEVGEENGNKICTMTGASSVGDFTVKVTALAEEGLFHFEITLKHSSRYSTKNYYAAICMTGTPEVTYQQSPMSIYGENNYGIGMAGGYLWDAGREATILFDYSKCTWMGADTYMPNRHGKIYGYSHNGITAFGLNTYAKSGGFVGSKYHITASFYLYGGFSVKRSGIDSVAQKAYTMQSVHPTQVEWPTVRDDMKSSVELNWTSFAAGTINGLLNPLAYNTFSMNMNDPVITSDSRGTEVMMSYARQSAERWSSTDFSCNNNWLAAGLGYTRLNDNKEFSEMLSGKMDLLQFYYDPECNMIRYNVRYNNNVGAYEMPWQNFFFNVETFRASVMADNADYSPAALANLLSSLEGLTELVEKNDYTLSQWIDPYNKTATTQQDRPDLNIVYEPWQIGSYAWLLVKAYDITGDSNYLELAKTALTEVVENISFTVSNDVYWKKYEDSGEFPITELYGTANGMYANYRLYELTGEEKYLSYSESFFGMLMQLTFWFDDNLSDAATTSTIVGLFEPHGGASHPCPWETIEAYIPMVQILDATGDYTYNNLMLRLLNCERISSYNFYPVTWSNYFRDQMAYNEADFYYIPTEPNYNSWGGGNSDYGALYMSSISFWNYLMFEAFGYADTKDILVLNTDAVEGFEAAVRAAERSFVLYNPDESSVTFQFKQDHLESGENYLVSYTQGGKKVEQTYTGKELVNGISITLASDESIRVSVTNTDETVAIAADLNVQARYELAYAYYLLREDIQKIAKENFAKIYPTASKSTLETLSNYVLTYVNYDDAIGLALNNGSTSEVAEIYANRMMATNEEKGLFKNHPEYHLDENYSNMLTALDEAAAAYRDGNLTTCHNVCERIIKAVKNGSAF